MDSLFDAQIDSLSIDVDDPMWALAHSSAARGRLSESPARDSSFPYRVAALLGSRPIAEAASSAIRQDWYSERYDILTFALAAIDLVVARQGFSEEATSADVVAEVAELARIAAPEMGEESHLRVAAYTLDALLNRSGRGAPFIYRIADYTDPSGAFRQRQIDYRLLVEREDPVRDEVVLNATSHAINALVGGLEFDVEDEQVAGEILLERQLARGQFAGAERAALRNRLLSMQYAEGIQRVIKETRRDLRQVLDEWADTMPQRMSMARDHIRARLDAEHRLLAKVHAARDGAGLETLAAAARIERLVQDCQRRHEALHRQVMDASRIFLEEQDRQAFRPLPTGYLPDLSAEVFFPLLNSPIATATAVGQHWLIDVAGPNAPRIPRLYRLINDLWTTREGVEPRDEPLADDEISQPDPPTISARVVQMAAAVVSNVGFPTRLSALIDRCLDPMESDLGSAQDLLDEERAQAATLIALAALWSFSPEDLDPDQGISADLATQILGPRAIADQDNEGSQLTREGWSGDDLYLSIDFAAHPLAEPDHLGTSSATAEVSRPIDRELSGRDRKRGKQ